VRLVRRDPNKGYIDTMMWLPKKVVNVDGLKRALTFEFEDRDSMRLLSLWDETKNHLIVPRGFGNPKDYSVPFVDCRPLNFHPTHITSRIKLDHKKVGKRLIPTGKTLQADSIQALMNSTGGTLQLACGKGKTVVALFFATLLQVPTIIHVDNTQLLRQWQEEIRRHLNVPGGVGLIKGQVKDWKKGIVMATYQTVSNWALTMPDEVRRWFGLIIWDEGHHVNAPVFSRGAPLFHGFRLALTATPNRSDGLHVVCNYHVGPIIYRDIKQDFPPKIYFIWTGLELDLDDPVIQAGVLDKNEDVHLGKVAVFFGQWRDRLENTVMPQIEDAINEGRKVLLLSNSVNEVINLQVLWTRGKGTPLYTDIPYPTHQELGLNPNVEPVKLNPAERKKVERGILEIRRNLAKQRGKLTPAKKQQYQGHIDDLKQKLAQHEVFMAIAAEYRKRQRKFLEDLLNEPSTSGVFTEAVPAEVRHGFLRTKRVIFAIMKYGKEGLDDKDLDTIIVSEPISDRNTLQQIMGRPRDKKNAVLVFLEDNVRQLTGQCVALRKHLREWPSRDGGPFKYELIGHPATYRRRGRKWTRGSLRVPGL
jgi:superfamily II DNA or RNA helicase